MEITEVLKLGQAVKVGTAQSGGKKYSGTVKKIKESLVAISVEALQNKDEVALGKPVLIIWKTDAGVPCKTRGEVIQNKALPIMVARVGEIVQGKAEAQQEAPKEKKEEPERTEDYDPDFDKKFIKQRAEGEEAERSSARVDDCFPMQFFVVDKATVAKKSKDYLSRKSGERRDDSKVSTDFNEVEITKRLAKADPAIASVIRDLYGKYSVLAARVFKKEVQGGGDENSGTCADLSGSGLQFLTKRQIKPGTVVKFILNPPASPPFSISALGEVMRVEKKKDPLDRKMKYAYGTRFYAIHEDDREAIIQYTFKRQQEMLKARNKTAGFV